MNSVSKPDWLQYTLAVLGFATCSAFCVTSQAAAQDAEALAKELNNPGAAKATLNFSLTHRTYDGDLPGASGQESTTLRFRPVFPFKLQNGDNLIFRPALTYAKDFPVFDSAAGRFRGEDGWLDIPFDVLYAWQNGDWTLGVGAVGSIPVGNSLSSDNWLLGPSFVAVKTTNWGLFGIFPSHNEKVGGSGPSTSLTSFQYFAFASIGNGWLIGTDPIITYNWEATSSEAWTFPVTLNVNKTTEIGGLPFKLAFIAEKNLQAPDRFSQDTRFEFQISPVVTNPFQRNPPMPSVDAATRAAVLAPISRY
ncbi:hypothetical protein [Ruegeria sp. HKCCD7559]|uniref:hypothetical protein n=1 Tax=Ruegeria sp. HKCCD7559 TaxID=2683005 RepID=UPI001490EE70|nr:hypothetical protein [Ruegeria sp. HKCCD7559]NOC47730.1 hypothetical protein [Ruegeria sp. HKCCD7559]